MRTVFFTILAFFLTPIAIADTEPNNTWQNALPLPQDRTVEGTQSDDDWYVINAAAGNRILIDLTFTHADGDIDVGFYDDLGNVSFPQFPGTLIANSVTDNSDHEFIDHNIPAIDTYYIRVYGGAGGDQGNSYTLTWTEIDVLPGDDGFEENDSSAAPAAIAESTVAFGSQSDEDWYSIDVVTGGRRVLVSMRFNAADDLDLELYDDGGTLLTSSANGVGVEETIDFEVAAIGTYHLNVTGNDSGESYAFNWTGLAVGGGVVGFPVPDVINDAPVATANTVSTTENTAYNFAATDFTFTDSDGDSLVSATINKLTLGGGSLTHSGGTTLNGGDTLTAAQLDTLVYTPPANLTGSPLTTFEFTVNDLMDAGTVAAQMDIDVTADTTTTSTGGGSSGSISLAWLFALMLIGLARRVHR
jgi:hypothetical protein